MRLEIKVTESESFKNITLGLQRLLKELI